MTDPESNKFEEMTDDVFGDSSLDETDYLSAIEDDFLHEIEAHDPETMEFPEETVLPEDERTVYATSEPTKTTHTADEKNWVLFTHLAGLAGQVFPFGGILGPLLVWQMKKQEMPFLDQHGKDAVNFQLSMALFMIISIPFMFIIIGIPALIALVFTQLIGTVLASIKAYNGEKYKYPLSLRFLK